MRRARRVVGAVRFLGAVLLLSGCASVPREAGFGQVERAVAERTGQRVHWNQGSASDEAVDAVVRSLLGKNLTADDAVQVALLNNGNLQATYEDLMIAQADLVAAGLLKNPVFDAELRFTKVAGHVGVEMALVQDFLDVFFIPLRARLAGAAFDAAKLRVTGQVLDLAGAVRTSFYSLQAAQQMLELRRQVLAATEASYDLSKRLRAAGNVTELDLANERALYEQSKLDVRTAEADVEQTRERLNALMGVWGEQTTWKAEARLPDLPASEGVAADVERRAIERSLDLEVARKQVEVDAAGLGIAAPLGLVGELGIGVSAEREPDGEWAAGPAFSVPIPLFNQGQPAVAAAQAELRRSRRRYTALAVEVRARARAAQSAALAARDRAEYYQKVLLPLRQKIVEQTQLQYNAMQVGPVQLLLAKQQQIDAGAAYVRTLRDFWVARAQLDQILNGRLTPLGGVAGGEASSSNQSAGADRGGH